MSDYIHLSPSYGPVPLETGGLTALDAPSAPDVSPLALAARSVLFVGFATLEEWARAVDLSRSVLATKLVVPGSSRRGFQTDELLVVCQQVTPEGHVLYCQLKAASLTRLCGQPFDPNWRERQAAWDSLWTCVQDFLAERNLSVRHATVAHPHGYVLFQARAESIAFNAQAGRYFRPAFPDERRSGGEA